MSKSDSVWRPPIHYPSMYSEIELTEPSIFESTQLNEWYKFTLIFILLI